MSQRKSKEVFGKEYDVYLQFQPIDGPGTEPQFTFWKDAAQTALWVSPEVQGGETATFKFHSSNGSARFTFKEFLFSNSDGKPTSALPGKVSVINSSSFSVTGDQEGTVTGALCVVVKIFDAFCNPVYSPDPQIKLRGGGGSKIAGKVIF